MKILAFLVAIIATALNSCKPNEGISSIKPQNGVIELPAKGEVRVWNDVSHGSFAVILMNNSTSQSCEVYKVKDGNESWISPSLMAGKTMTITIPEDGHLYVKNFNPNVIKINYSIE